MVFVSLLDKALGGGGGAINNWQTGVYTDNRYIGANTGPGGLVVWLRHSVVTMGNGRCHVTIFPLLWQEIGEQLAQVYDGLLYYISNVFPYFVL